MMEDFIQNYLQAKNTLFGNFNCKEQYFVRDLLNLNWTIKFEADTYILAYWENEKKPTHAIITKKDGKPCIYKSEEHTMIIGIDCVKIAFVLNSARENTRRNS